MSVVELRVWSGCPSHDHAHELLRATLTALGRPSPCFVTRWVESESEAAEIGFIGSPTFTVDGQDVLPPPYDEPTGLNCRVYIKRDGRFSPLPDPDDLRDALATAIAPQGSQ